MKNFLKKGENPVFSLLIFLLPAQLGYHFFSNFSYVFGIRVDYLAPTLYLTDALVLLLFIFWFLREKKIRINYWAISILGFAAVNILFASLPQAALFKWIKVLELIFLGNYVSGAKNLDIQKNLILPLALSISFFSLVGIGQFLFQKTLGGPLYLLGERTFDSQTPGIALFGFFGKEFLRPYSTFSHPNSLAGFMLVASLLVALLNRNKKKIMKVTLFLGAASVFLSVSLNAYISLLAVVIFYLIFRKRKRLAAKIVVSGFFLTLIISLALPIVANVFINRGGEAKESLFNRLVLAQASGKMLSKSPVWGVGLNNFIPELPTSGILPRVSWWLQPVHNTNLLVLAETGIFGLLIYLGLVFKSLQAATKQKSWAILLPVLAILITGLFDHYWLTLQQNQLLFSLILGLSFRRDI